MCRIAGVVNKNFPVTEVQQWVQGMCDALIHGGPDSGGLHQIPAHNIVLGNRRLALQDLSDAGKQPMHYKDRYSITYNGEIYNFLSLRQELESLGHQFHNHTDTEVIMAAFDQWKTAAFKRFNGMFAFCLWDSLENQIYLVRDAAGMKPLYYSTANNGLAFASEIRAFKSVPYLNEKNKNWEVYLMAYGHIPEPVTTLKDVQPLHKGCFIKYDVQQNKLSYQSFKHYTYSNIFQNRTEIIDRLRTEIYSGVERHLIADASIGVFLSGGLDSSLITRVAADVGKSSLNTFSLYFGEESFSEKKYQDMVLSTVQSNAYQHLLTEKEFNESFPQILRDMDMPGCDGMNTWFISKYARMHGLKAVLSGIGGDELFGGYPSFSRMQAALGLQKSKSAYLPFSRYSSKKQLNRLSYLKLEGMKGLYLFLRGYFTVTQIAEHLGASEKEIYRIIEELPVVENLPTLTAENKASWMEFNLYMQNQLMRDADVMGMAHGVEIRLPLLDDEVVNFATQIQSEIKYSGNFKKQLLIDVIDDKLPEDIWQRPKMGFSFPFDTWLRNNDFVRNTMENGNKQLKKSMDQFLEGKIHWSKIVLLTLLNSDNKSMNN